MTLDAINGIQGRTVSAGQVRPASPEYQRIVQILRKAQVSGSVGLRIEVGKDERESLVMFFRDPDIDPELSAELNEARKLLRIDPAQREVHVIFGATRGGPNETTMATRSLYRVLGVLAASVQVPEVRLSKGRSPPLSGDLTEENPRFTVLSGCEKPSECDCFTAICYRGSWFWIDDRDTQSKRVMAYLMVLLALADTGAKETVPFLTIQAN